MHVHQLAAAKTPRKPRRRPEPVQTTQVPPIAMQEARRLAKGEDVRIEVQRDGSVIVRNGARP